MLPIKNLGLVIDPLLPEHLSHWGIDIMKLEKTDKTLLEMEDSLNLSYDWSKMTESGEKLELLYGPKMVGFQNIGSSCYLSSVLQVLLHITEIQTAYLDLHRSIIETCNKDPVDDFMIQMSKLAMGILSDNYCPMELMSIVNKAIESGKFV